METIYSTIQATKREIIKFLQDYYGGCDEDFEFKWKPDIRNTKVIITDQFAINLGEIQKTPSITVSRGSISFRDRIPGLRDINWKDTTFRYLDLYIAQIQINCQSIYGLVAERLAEYTFNVFLYYGENCWKKLVPEIHQIFPLEVGSEIIQKGDTGPDIVNVPILIGFEITKSWAITNQGPKLEDIKIKGPVPPEEL
mgnify:FL=1